MRLAGLVILSLVLTHPVWAEVVPVASNGDPHIQTVAYDPAEVVALNFAPGFALTVQFSPDEQIETVILGDSGSWTTQTSRRADHLVILPRGAPPPTNMTIFTDQRTYNFILYANPMGPSVQPYLVSFTYPSVIQSQPDGNLSAGQYRLRGDKRLWPEEMGDNGLATSIRWATEVTLPAVYSENDRGDLALVNGVMREGIYVLDAVYSKLVFIRGKSRAGALRKEARP
jgi:type IV secretion system protein VirB9